MTLKRRLPSLSYEELSRHVHALHADEYHTPWWSEFEQPFQLLRMFFVAPLERRLVNTIDRYTYLTLTYLTLTLT